MQQTLACERVQNKYPSLVVQIFNFDGNVVLCQLKLGFVHKSLTSECKFRSVSLLFVLIYHFGGNSSLLQLELSFITAAPLPKLKLSQSSNQMQKGMYQADFDC